jgi:hypothetical protein
VDFLLSADLWTGPRTIIQANVLVLDHGFDLDAGVVWQLQL